MDVLLHALKVCEEESGNRFNTIALLQATSPLRHPLHIREAIAKLEDGNMDSVVSVADAKNSPYFNLLERSHSKDTYVLSKDLPIAVTRRQDAPDVFRLNGSIYVWERGALLTQQRTLCDRTGIYRMPSLCSADIDTEEDWAFAELAAALLDQRDTAKAKAD